MYMATFTVKRVVQVENNDEQQHTTTPPFVNKKDFKKTAGMIGADVFRFFFERMQTTPPKTTGVAVVEEEQTEQCEGCGADGSCCLSSSSSTARRRADHHPPSCLMVGGPSSCSTSSSSPLSTTTTTTTPKEKKQRRSTLRRADQRRWWSRRLLLSGGGIWTSKKKKKGPRKPAEGEKGAEMRKNANQKLIRRWSGVTSAEADLGTNCCCLRNELVSLSARCCLLAANRTTGQWMKEDVFLDRLGMDWAVSSRGARVLLSRSTPNICSGSAGLVERLQATVAAATQWIKNWVILRSGGGDNRISGSGGGGGGGNVSGKESQVADGLHKCVGEHLYSERFVLSEFAKENDCFEFEGDQGVLSIQLPTRIDISAIVFETPPFSSSSSSLLSTNLPKRVRVETLSIPAHRAHHTDARRQAAGVLDVVDMMAIANDQWNSVGCYSILQPPDMPRTRRRKVESEGTLSPDVTTCRAADGMGVDSKTWNWLQMFKLDNTSSDARYVTTRLRFVIEGNYGGDTTCVHKIRVLGRHQQQQQRQ
eukprot:GHVS01030641.1.p1 GENE.GHVS01030641.1~~GHVS01030641.1.p1  ORF type:complete len:535 (+),score=137.33 GHVS01030641.1:3-1607(+)